MFLFKNRKLSSHI
jgi:hypothetical protein